MKTIMTASAVALLAWAGMATAHGPSRQKVEESIDISAPPQVVWDLVKDFSTMHTWCPRIVSETSQGGNEKGAVRELKFASGRVAKEELKNYDAEKMTYQYKINEVDPMDLPVANYSSTLEVKPSAAGGATVEWSGAFYRSFMTNNPPPEQSDAAAVAGVTGLYKECLASLKSAAEARK
jgi:carbon monoxide dehydrogenase subunit G